MSDKPDKLITDDGLRLDGRRADEIRPMKIEIGVLSRADGSCYLEWGRNKILVGVLVPGKLILAAASVQIRQLSVTDIIWLHSPWKTVLVRDQAGGASKFQRFPGKLSSL